MRVALVHDWLTGMRGGERVLEQMCALFPEADLFTLFHHKGSVSPAIEAMQIRTSFLDLLPGIHRNYRYFLPLYPWAISSLDLNGYDLILSSSHAVAKSVRKPPGSLHICYCHTPMRYIWDSQADYFQYGDPLRLRRTALRALSVPLRSWDRRTSHRVDCFIANSRHVQERIARCYNRAASVIYPPVDTTFFSPSQNGHGRGFYLIVSALVPSKRLDLAVEAFNRLGRPLLIAGSGPELPRLRALSARNVHFQGFVSDEELRELYWRCRAVVVPGREDFGIVALEAQACGRPVVAFAAGGSLESVKDGETGILFGRQNAEDLAGAVRRAEDTSFDPAKLRQNAERFSSNQFREALQSAVQEALRNDELRLTNATNDELRMTNDEWTHEAQPSSAFIARHSSLVTRHSSLATRHSSFVTRHSSLSGARGLAKRTFDVLLAISGLALLGLPLLLTALLIRLTSPGPGFFLQKRVGPGGRIFRMAKLRTMHRNAEKENVAIWAVDCDPRCAPLGNLLRRYGIDELPQLWNILRGEMSFVGPRPERPEFHRLFSERDPRFARRLEVQGGLTGLAQVRGWRGNTSVEERLKSDLEYVDNWSLSRDLFILLQTPLALWQGKKQASAPPPEIPRTDAR